MNYDMEINNAKAIIKRNNLNSKYYRDVLDTAYFEKLEANNHALKEAKKVFELNAEYEKPNPNRVGCLLKHQAS